MILSRFFLVSSIVSRKKLFKIKSILRIVQILMKMWTKFEKTYRLCKNHPPVARKLSSVFKNRPIIQIFLDDRNMVSYAWNMSGTWPLPTGRFLASLVVFLISLRTFLTSLATFLTLPGIFLTPKGAIFL